MFPWYHQFLFFFLKISLFFPILLFSSNSLHCTLKKAVQSLQNQRWSELNLPISIDLSSLIPKMSVFILANLLLDHIQFTLIHGPNIPGSIAILFFIGSDLIFTTRHIHNWKSFPLWPSLFIPSGAISPVFSSSMLKTFQPGQVGFIFQRHIFLPFPTVHGARILEWFAIPSSSESCFVRSCIIKGISYARRATIRDRKDKDLRSWGDKNTQKTYTKKVMMTWIPTMVWSLT